MKFISKYRRHKGALPILIMLALTGLGLTFSAATAAPAAQKVGSSTDLFEAMTGRSADAPMCLTCGVKMRAAGACYVCEGCGSTSGWSRSGRRLPSQPIPP